MAGTIDKLLIIRLSSIGDIVLTSPVIRSLRKCFPDTELHFLTKGQYAPLLTHNPHLDRLHFFRGDLNATVAELRAEGFDRVLDLHRSIRSRLIRARLRVPSVAYPKDRIPVLMYTKLKLGSLPERHTVDRYFAAAEKLGCTSDGGGLEFHMPEDVLEAGRKTVEEKLGKNAVAVVLGGKWATKKWPVEYFINLLNALGRPVLLLGGPEERPEAERIAAGIDVPVCRAAGEYGLLASAALMRACGFVLTHDTGLMHIAVAMSMKVFSIWGSTVPELGFAPYRAADATVIQHTGLPCRPCSKIGYAKCPKGHFRCMREIMPEQVLTQIRANTP